MRSEKILFLIQHTRTVRLVFFYRIYRCMLLLLFSFEFLLVFCCSPFFSCPSSSSSSSSSCQTLLEDFSLLPCLSDVTHLCILLAYFYLSIWKTVGLLCKRYDWQTDKEKRMMMNFLLTVFFNQAKPQTPRDEGNREVDWSVNRSILDICFCSTSMQWWLRCSWN